MGNGKARHRRKVEELLEGTDIRINGSNPWDIQIKDDRFYRRVLAQGSLGLGESYMDGWWECDAIDQMLYRILRKGLERTVVARVLAFDLLGALLLNLQSKSRAWIVGKQHYDIGNDLYERMLDPLMIYSCGYWKEARTLAEAQEAKLDLVCRKLQLQAGMRVLDIGCGWGGAAKFVAERYGCEVVGITISEKQAAYARDLCADLPVEIRLQDYRDLNERFDRVFSIGMFEHVGYRNYRAFMETVRRVLPETGLFLLHTIGGNRSVRTTEPWINRYIFPNGMLPSIHQIAVATEERFVMEDWHNFGVYYDNTLLSWFARFEESWPELSHSYDDRFYRMWKYYLLSSAAGFRARKNQLWQIVLSPKGVSDGYASIR